MTALAEAAPIANPRKSVRRTVTWTMCSCGHSERTHHGWTPDGTSRRHGTGRCHMHRCECVELVAVGSVSAFAFAYDDDPRYAYEGDGEA